MSVKSVWEVTADNEKLTKMSTIERIGDGRWYSEARPGGYYSVLVFPSNKNIQYGHKILICTH